MSVKKIIGLFTAVVALYFGVVVFVARLLLPKIEAPAANVVLGAVAGSLGAVMGAALTALVTLWARSSEDQQRLKDQASRQALELTRMDYELRKESLAVTKERRQFLAPIKVYREVYRALLQLHGTGEWPDTLYKLGLLNIFPLGEGGEAGDDTPPKKTT